jgi:hypothetical protein
MQTIDTSRFPKKGNVARWVRIIELSRGTIMKGIASKELTATRHLNGRDLLISKEDMVAWYRSGRDFLNRIDCDAGKERKVSKRFKLWQI